MSRLARVIAAGLPHHITQRGNYRQNIFCNDGDRITYLGLISEYSKPARLRLIGYCLMTNHVHLIVVPEREDSLARGLGQAHCRYAHCVNARLHSTGHLRQNRFYSTVMDESHLLAAMRYVERNPVRAGMVADAAGYRWSSAMAHLTGLDVTGCLDLRYWAARVGPEEWRSELGVTEEPDEWAAIRVQTATGRPLGSKEFVAELGRKMRRVLEPRAIGRPRKSPEGRRDQRRTDRAILCTWAGKWKQVACHGFSVTVFHGFSRFFTRIRVLRRGQNCRMSQATKRSPAKMRPPDYR